MFFNSKDKIAKQIGSILNNTLRPPFIWSDYLSSEGIFSPPLQIFSDSYIGGFIYGLAGFIIKYDFNGDAMSVTKKGDILIRSLKYAFGESYKPILEMANAILLNGETNNDFRKGTHDAGSMYGALTGRLLQTIQIRQSRMQRFWLKKISQNFGDDNTGSSLGAAVGMLTINKHIKENYLRDIT